MKVIRSNEAIEDANSDVCKTVEYSFNDKDIDYGLATITGRYPESGCCVNLVSKELFYVLEGSLEVCCEEKNVKLQKGDSFLINNNEKYYLNSDYCKVSMTCTPAWSLDQHKIV